MQPIIGITVVPQKQADPRTGGTLKLNYNYAQAVAEAGGTPMLLPPQADPETVLATIHGLIIPGGDDIDPATYGEPVHPKASLEARERFDFEQKLIQGANNQMPILGICYGCQALNVVAGGTLIQHLPDLVGSDADQGGTLQSYELNPESKSAQALGTAAPRGESWHHQAVDKVGHGLVVTGRNGDGTIEALEATDRDWVVGVQWHPERTQGASDSQNLFRTLIEKAKAYADVKQ